MDISVVKTKNPGEIPEASTLGFGNYFTDHMFLMDYSSDKGWYDARIVPFAPLTLHPASTVLHYGSEIFEGLKAYIRPDGKTQTFRPDKNIARMNNSARRMCLPTLNESFLLKALDTLLSIEKRWVPNAPNTSLYIRPFLIGVDETLGVHVAQKALFAIILSPVGNYYKEGLGAVPIMIETQDVRAVRGGMGEAKCGGNYAASLRAGSRAEEKGYSQVLWLDGVERKYIEEVGSMNVMFKIGDEIVTPALSGSILPGITRMSCIEMLKSKGHNVIERLVSLDELIGALKSGELKEAWGCGTAAVISPIGKLVVGDDVYTVGDGKIGELAQDLYDSLTAIQWGTAPDTFGWTHIVE